MNFNSFEFLVFFPIVTLVYFVIPKKVQWIWLLISSYYFYMCWNPVYALLILFSTAVTYLSGVLIDKTQLKIKDETKSIKIKKLLVFASVALNLSILFFYKYFNFVVANINRAFSIIDIEVALPAFDVLLPVGISFYTFQALGYTIDVYRNNIKVERNFFKYALFVSFFPQLVAGPIERSKNLLHQLNKTQKFNYDRVKSGLLLMLWGLFQKIVVADRIAIFVNEVYGNYAHSGGALLALASVLFAVQIYCDFAGYCDIARGGARVLGIELMKNFNNPYSAQSIKEFWGRWHISLSTWFRDYLYIPLGGSRCSKMRKYFNIMAVFIISGLWHGASWGFVFWGFMHGSFQIIEDAIKPIGKKLVNAFKIDVNTFSHRLLKGVVVFIIVDIAWIFFRTQSFSLGLEICKLIITDFNLGKSYQTLSTLSLSKIELIIMIVSIAIFWIFDNLRSKVNLFEFIIKQQLWFRWLSYLLLIMVMVYCGVYGTGYTGSEFIYFQF